MTLPYESANAVKYTRDFMNHLAWGGGKNKRFKTVPKEIREMARRCLRHYPTGFDWAVKPKELLSALREAYEIKR